MPYLTFLLENEAGLVSSFMIDLSTRFVCYTYTAVPRDYWRTYINACSVHLCGIQDLPQLHRASAVQSQLLLRGNTTRKGPASAVVCSQLSFDRVYSVCSGTEGSSARFI